MLVLRVESMLPRHCVKPGLLPRSLSRTKSGGGWGGGGATELLCLLVLVKRHGVLLLAPLVYLSITLIYMGRISPDPDMPPGSVYRSPQLFRHLWPDMLKANTSFGIVSAWQHCKEDELWRPCIDNSKSLQGLPRSTGFLIVEANGGLNQQRSSICNAVAVASLLNATLVIPRFHLNSVWKDPSPFADIYDQEHFIKSLAEYVRIVRQVPDYVMESVGYNMSNIFNFRVKAWSPASFYLETVLPKLRETGVIRISPFANRLSFDNIPPMIQQLRCFTNFEALRFSEQILATGKLLVDRMVKHSASSDGKYIAVHLRFEEDMVAFSCCIYDGGNEEKLEMDAARERGWRGKFNRTGRIIDPGANRVDGKCPLTPLEVGMMLRGMGFHSSTPIYIAAGKIYKADKTMTPLLQMFPRLQTKETLLSPKELAPFEKYSSRMAALDYMVCLHSEVFVTTQGGNFPHFLIGHRRFLYNGHSKTINPDKRKLALLLDSPDIGWDSLSSQLESMREHSDAKGHDLRKPTASIYTYPAPDCMCLHHYDNMDPLTPS